VSRHMTFRLTDEEIALLDAGCRSLDLNRSAFLRFALREAVKSADIEQRLAAIERSLSEIAGLLRSGAVPPPTSSDSGGGPSDGMRQELQQSLRGIIDGDF